MNDEARIAVLARWKARIEAAGKGFPTDEDLLELMDLAARDAVAEEQEKQSDRCKEGRC